jgi:hypothetical protein
VQGAVIKSRVRVISLAAAFLAALVPAGCGGASPRTTKASRASTSAGSPAGRSARPAEAGTPGNTARSLLGLPQLRSASPLPGYLMIADRNNNRLIVVAPDHRVVWRFPRPRADTRRQRFAGPDDAFLTPSGRAIITNEEFSDAIAEIALGPHPRIVWSYGHACTPVRAPGYLAHPDDAYLLPNGLVSVADIINCRILLLDRAGRTVRSIEPGTFAYGRSAAV